VIPERDRARRNRCDRARLSDGLPMRAVSSTALALFALVTCGPAAVLAAAHPNAGASCSSARDQGYELHGYVCVEAAGRHRLAQIVAAPARPKPPRAGTLVPLAPK
jgi:hypothetical protein